MGAKLSKALKTLGKVAEGIAIVATAGLKILSLFED